MGGPYDEAILCFGCLVGGVKFEYESSSSAIKGSLQNGVFVNTELRAVEYNDTIPEDGTYVQSRSIVPMQWGCLQTLEAGEVDSLGWTKIANNEQTNFSISRSIQTVPDCGERIDTAFYEGGVQAITIGARVYSRNANQWQTRMHTGGVRNDIAVGGKSSPRKKGLQTIPNIRIATATSDTKYECFVQFNDVSVDSWGNTYNMNSEIVESPKLTALNGFICIKTPDVLEPLVSGVTTPAKITTTVPGKNTETAEIVTYYPKGMMYELPYIYGQTSKKWTGSDNVSYSQGQKVTIKNDISFTSA